jgi:osmotically-inducible protein OsmY
MILRSCIAVLLFLALVAVGAAKDPKVIPDGLIEDQVRLKLANDQVVKGAALQVEVAEGVVTLSGQLFMAKQRDRAANLAKKIKGVKRVVNNIVLREQSAQR